MALGKAFIEVHADTAPFARELGDQLEKIVSGADAKVKASSRKIGETVAKETGNGVEKEKEHVRRGLGNSILYAANNSAGLFSKISKGIIDSIDDGISGLPDEIKMVLGAALVAVLPIAFAVGGGIAQALTTGLLLGGGAVFGAVIGAQFEEVSRAARDTFSALRTEFLQAASRFTGNFFIAIDAVRDRFKRLQPELVVLFSKITGTFEPIVDSVFNLIENALPGISSAFDNIDKFLVPLQGGLALIGDSIGNFFETVMQNEDSSRVFADILLSVSELIDLFTFAVDISISWYGVLLDIGQALGLLADAEKELKPLAGTYERTTAGAERLNGAIKNTIKPLEDETKAIQDLNKELKTYLDFQFSIIEGELDFNEGLLRLTESLKENGATLADNTQAGINNSRLLLQLARNIIDTRNQQILMTGDVAGATAKFNAQRDELYEVARQSGLTRAAADKLIGELLKIPPPANTGITQGSVDRLKAGWEWANRLASKIASLVAAGAASVFAGATPHAMGGVFTQPHVGLVAEAGPEAIIPLNNPQRAAQVMAQAGLSGMTSPVVNVYIGNQQIDAYIDARVDDALNSTARSLTYGMRGI